MPISIITMIRISTSHFLYIYLWLTLLNTLFIIAKYFLFAFIFQIYMINIPSFFLGIPLLQLHTSSQPNNNDNTPVYHHC